MNTNLLFDFSVNKENNTIHVKREFDANLGMVWKAWTTAELLDQWWAPAPYRNQTKSMDFREGGTWLYSMISPENETHWSRFDYEKIDEQKSYTGLDAFCDETGKINTDFDRMHWENVFSETAGHTTVNITISVGSWDTLKKIIQMGFKEGFTQGLNQLEELLSKQKASNKITISTTVNGDVQQVWKHYTEPAHITQWNFAHPSWHCPSATNDMRVGGKYSARMEAKDGSYGFDFEAVYDEVIAGKSFSYTMSDGRSVSVLFNENKGQTELIITFDPEEVNPVEMQKAGWQAILDNFKNYSEAQ